MMEVLINTFKVISNFLIEISENLDNLFLQLAAKLEPVAGILAIPVDIFVIACLTFTTILIVGLSVLLFRHLYPPRINEAIDKTDGSFFFELQMEELAMDAEALEELYDKGYISAALFHEEAVTFKQQSDLLINYILSK